MINAYGFLLSDTGCPACNRFHPKSYLISASMASTTSFIRIVRSSRFPGNGETKSLN